MQQAGIGDAVRRKEDERLISGRGSYADDLPIEGVARAVVVRSPHAHAHIRSIHGKLDVRSRSAATRFAFEHHLA